MEPTLPKAMIFVRHAIATPAEAFDGPDSERPLTPKGAAKAAKIFAKLTQLYRPTRVISSPLVRAKATAELLQGALPRPRPAVEISSALGLEATVEAWRSEIARLDFAADDVVVIVGHEPSIGALFASHLGLKDPVPFKKASIGILAPETLSHGTLVAFLPPKAFLDRRPIG